MTNILTVQIKYVYNTFMFAKSDKNIYLRFPNRQCLFFKIYMKIYVIQI